MVKWFDALLKLLDGMPRRSSTVAMQPLDQPWLMVSHNKKIVFQRFFSPYHKVHRLELPEAHGKSCCGSSKGYLIMFDLNLVISLLNPVTRHHIQLPPIPIPNPSLLAEEQCTVAISKVIISSDPLCTPDDYVAMAIYGEYHKLAFYRKGDQTWTVIQDSVSFYDDIIYYNEEFYAVDECGRVVICSTGLSPQIREVAPPWFFHGDKIYLVGLQGELLLVIRYMDKDPDFVYYTTTFKVFSFDPDEQEWYQVNNIGQWVLFLGHNQSVSLPTCDFSGFQENCIYFTDDYSEGYEVGGHDLGVFHIEDDHIKPLPCFPGDIQLIWPPRIWVIPDIS